MLACILGEYGVFIIFFKLTMELTDITDVQIRGQKDSWKHQVQPNI